jgi:excisionase family DNA binding protein
MNAPLISDDERPVRIKTIAEWAGVSQKTVRRWIDSGELKSVKMGGLRVVLPRDFREFWEKINPSEDKNVQTRLQTKG